jgi:glycosyltransferase involved in cell wall biosynthesis
MHMREEDWKRCEASFGKGSVTVHWTDPADRSQSYIPMASPFVTKLASIVTSEHAAKPFDVIFSHYMEPYGIAGYLAAQITGLPHVVRMAGSDSGRLWHHAQFEPVYDHVLRSAEVVIAVGAVAERLAQRGVDRARIAAGGAFTLPEHLFTPEGPRLNIDAFRAELSGTAGLRDELWGQLPADRPYFGIYGKLGENKGSFAILSALHRLKQAGVHVGLLVLAHGQPQIERRFRERVVKLGLSDRVLQIPFIPHWRVPEFLRGCLAVCCLEQDFPILHHSPITALEVLLCGKCLVGSVEIIRKLPGCEQLPHGHGCVAIKDVKNAEELCAKLADIVREPALAVCVGARGRSFALNLQRDIDFPGKLERILETAAQRRTLSSGVLSSAPSDQSGEARFRLTRIVAAALAEMDGNGALDRAFSRQAIDLVLARKILERTNRAIAEGTVLRSLATAVQIEIAIAAAEHECDVATDAPCTDPLFRLNGRRWALGDGDLAGLVCVREPSLRLLRFDYDVAAFRVAKAVADFPSTLKPGPSAIVTFGRSNGARREPLFIDESTARILDLSDGTRTAAEIITQLEHEQTGAKGNELEWIEYLFVEGLIGLRQKNPTFVSANAKSEQICEQYG